MLETRESPETFESFLNGFLGKLMVFGFFGSARLLIEAHRNLLPSGGYKENANHFFSDKTIVDKDIRVTGTVTW